MDSMKKGILTVVIATVITSAMILSVDSSNADSQNKNINANTNTVDAKSENTAKQAKDTPPSFIKNENNASTGLKELLPPPGPFSDKKVSLPESKKSLNKPQEPDFSLSKKPDAPIQPDMSKTVEPKKITAEPTLSVEKPEIIQPENKEIVSKSPSPKEVLSEPKSPLQPKIGMNVDGPSANADVKKLPSLVEPVKPQQQVTNSVSPQQPVFNNATSSSKPIWMQDNPVFSRQAPVMPQMQPNMAPSFTIQPNSIIPSAPINPSFNYPQGVNNYYMPPPVPTYWMPPVMPFQAPTINGTIPNNNQQGNYQ